MNVEIKTISNGFEITHKSGKVERISLAEVQKVFISNYPPNQIKEPEVVKKAAQFKSRKNRSAASN